jgi:predicted NUDIX family phosphoesterase
MSEQVMVVEREAIDRFLVERGLIRSSLEDFFEVVVDRHFFIDRPTAESSPQYKQIIPYVIIRHGDSVFLLRRSRKQTESRLHDKLSIGIGGHINPDTSDLLAGLQKELDEEVAVGGDYEIRFAGILNDDTTEVGRVHVGAVYILETATGDVRVLETEKMSGQWVPLSELGEHRDAMETWSQIAYDELLSPL